MTQPSLTTIPAIVAALDGALADARALPFGAWQVQSVGPRTFMNREVPVVMLEHAGRTLGFIVTPTDPNERVYKRTARFDVVYFSEDVADDAQQGVYDANRATIDAFVAWLTAWDRGAQSG